MQIERKLAILADAAKYDASCASSGSHRERAKNGIGNVTGTGICHSYAPDGRCISLLKILLTNYCVYDCQFCINRISSNTPRARFTPEEVAALTIDFYKRNYIEGLFLSSGIIQSVDYTMELLIRSAEIFGHSTSLMGTFTSKRSPDALQNFSLRRQVCAIDLVPISNWHDKPISINSHRPNGIILLNRPCRWLKMRLTRRKRVLCRRPNRLVALSPASQHNLLSVQRRQRISIS